MKQESGYSGAIVPTLLYSIEQAAKELSVSARTFRQDYIKSGKVMIWKVNSKKFAIPGWCIIQLAEENLGFWEDEETDESE